MDATPWILLSIVILALLALVFGLLAVQFRKKAEQLGQELILGGEPPILGPEVAHFAPGQGFGVVKTDGTLALTEARLIFRKPFGGEIILPLADVARLEETTTFRGNWKGGRKFLVVRLRDGREAAFIARDNTRWLAELRARTEG